MSVASPALISIPDSEKKPSLFNMYIYHGGEDNPYRGKDMVMLKVAQDISLALTNSYSALYDTSRFEEYNAILQVGLGKSTVIGGLTRQIWQGASVNTVTFNVVSVAYENPVEEVRAKLRKLYSMAAPTDPNAGKNPVDFEKGVNEAMDIVAGFPIHPIKSIKAAISEAMSLKDRLVGVLLEPPEPVTILIPGIIHLRNVVIVNVDMTQSTRLVRAEPGAPACPIKFEGAVTVQPLQILSKYDVDQMFPDPIR